jgi:hypothetical protein
MIAKIVDMTLMESMDINKMEGSVAYLVREQFLSGLQHEWFWALKESNTPHPLGFDRDKYLW